MAKYQVQLPNGDPHDYDADFAFEDRGHLVLRKGVKGNTTVTAIYAPGEWKHVKRLADNSQEPPVREDNQGAALQNG